MPLFAQNGPPVDIFLILFGVCCGIYIVALIPWIFFLLALSRALALCHPYNRTMEPGMVWLNLIPLFNYVWLFVTQVRVSQSLEAEFRDRRWHRRGDDYALMTGIVSSAMVMSSTAMSYCGLPVLVAGFVMWILYWVKVVNLSRELASGPRDDGYAADDRPQRDRDRDDETERKPWERG